jgi:plasmid stabilization system protein ParE
MKIIWTDTAINDLKGIKEYISRDSEYYATQIIDKIIASYR